MSVLQHEGTFPVMAATLSVLVGSHYRIGYLARPDQAGRFPTVALIPHLGILGSHEKALSHRLARHGLAVIAASLAEGTPADPQVAYAATTDEEAMRVLDEVHEWVKSEDNAWAQADRIGVLGVDVGGRFALMQAAHRDWVGSVAVVATPLTGDEARRYPVAEMLGHLPVPVLGLYGADDRLIPAASVDEAQRRNDAGSWLIYAGAAHGFSDEGSEEYDHNAAEDAVSRLASFFLATLPAAETIALG